MEFFPFSLIRLSGLPFPERSHPLKKSIDQLKILREKYQKDREILRSRLQELKERDSDYFNKDVINNLIRDLNHNRNISFKSRFAFLEKLGAELETFRHSKKKLEEELTSFCRLFENQRKEFRVQLKNNLQSKEILSSIWLSNPAASNSIKKYLLADSNLENKKLRRSELSALKYCSRASAKTSPFAALGPQAWIGTKTPLKKVTRVNQALLIYLEEYFLNNPDSKKYLTYRRNPTVWKENDHFVFLFNNRNFEQIKQLPVQEILLLLVKNFSMHALSLADWATAFMDQVDADQSELVGFFGLLATEGFLQPVLPCERENPDWLMLWQNYLEDKNEAEFDNLKAVLQKTIELNESDKIDPKEIGEAISLWKQCIGPGFDLSPERFIYRDDFADSTNNKKIEFPFDPGILNEILPLMRKIHFSKPMESLKNFFLEQEKKEIPLLAFYKLFHESKPINLEEEILFFETTIEKYRQSCKEYLDLPKDEDCLKISLEQLQNILGPAEKSFAEESWLGAIIQKGEGLPYLRNVFPGHGKMMARFIQTSNVADKIKSLNSKSKDLIYADHSDSSAFNANLHPELTEFKIAPINSSSHQNNQMILPFEDLVIRNERSEMVLWSKSLDKQVIPLNYGLEGLDRRSPLYQLIQYFGPEFPDLDQLKLLLRPLVLRKHLWGSFIPRLAIGEDFIFQRKQWVIKTDSLPKRSAGENTAHFFLRNLEFFESITAPHIGFLKLISEDTDLRKKSQNFQKPQFINLREPSYFLLFEKFISMAEKEIRLEEIYPFPCKSGAFKDHCQEWVMEWLV